MATEQQTTSRRVPTPPTTRAQEEVFAEATEQNEDRGDAVENARSAIRAARRSLQEAEDEGDGCRESGDASYLTLTPH
jgi:hypothetical protein